MTTYNYGPANDRLWTLLAHMDRTFKAKCYDERDPARGITDDERSEQLASDMVMHESALAELLGQHTGLNIEPEDMLPATTEPVQDVAFSYAETRRVTA